MFVCVSGFINRSFLGFLVYMHARDWEGEGCLCKYLLFLCVMLILLLYLAFIYYFFSICFTIQFLTLTEYINFIVPFMVFYVMLQLLLV